MTLLAITSKTVVAKRRVHNKSVRARALTSRITFPSYSRCVQRSIPKSKHQPVEANPALLLCPLSRISKSTTGKNSIGQQKHEEYLNECGCTTAPGEAGCTAWVFPKPKVRNNTAYAAPLGGEYLRSCARHPSRILALLPDETSMSAPITVVLNREAMLRR